MSVYANTLNAYAGKLKAQLKAQKREAELAARRKSAEENLADKMRIEQARAEKIEEENKKKFNAVNLSNIVLDNVARIFRTRHNQYFAAGERAKVASDLKKISQLFFYSGSGKMYLKVDASQYTETAFNIMVSAMVNMTLLDEEQGRNPKINILRQITIIRDNEDIAVTLSPINTSVESLKEAVATPKRSGSYIF